MKIRFQCNSCPQINNKANTHVELPITDKLYYEFECKQGHFNKVMLRNNKFDLIFESGLHALIDGYSREAATSFSVSLERYYEYVINILLVCNNNLEFELMEKFKKDVKLSERLFGVFCTMYLLTFKKIIPAFDSKFLKTNGLELANFENQPVNLEINLYMKDIFLAMRKQFHMARR